VLESKEGFANTTVYPKNIKNISDALITNGPIIGWIIWLLHQGASYTAPKYS